MDEHHSWYNGSVWHIVWPYQIYVGHWLIFYGPANLPHILKTIWWRNIVLGIMDQYDSKIDLIKYMWVSDLYFMVHCFYLISLSDLNYFYTLRNGTGQGYSCPSGQLPILRTIITGSREFANLVKMRLVIQYAGSPEPISRILESSESGVRNLPPPCCVLEQDTLLPESTG